MTDRPDAVKVAREASALKDAGAREGAEADTRLNAEKGGFDHPAALATKQPADSRSDPALGTAREAPDMAGDKVGVSTLASTPAGAGDLVGPEFAAFQAMSQQEKAESKRIGSIIATLKAMALNYSGGHCWDRLDGQAVIEAADIIAALQAEVAREKLRADAEAAEVNVLTHQRDAFRRDRNLAEADLAALRAEVEPVAQFRTRFRAVGGDWQVWEGWFDGAYPSEAHPQFEVQTRTIYTRPPTTDAIKAQARREALEECGAWHDDQAALHDAQGEACGTGSDGWKRHTVAAADHRRSAAAIRALADNQKGKA